MFQWDHYSRKILFLLTNEISKPTNRIECGYDKKLFIDAERGKYLKHWRAYFEAKRLKFAGYSDLRRIGFSDIFVYDAYVNKICL